MDDIPQNPLFHRPPTVVERGPIPASTCSSPPAKPKISAATLEAISQLGLRYQPSAQGDMQAHGARVALLANDLADIPADRLRAAIARWVSFRPFLPKASELRSIAENLDGQPLDAEALADWCDERNAWARRIGADWWYRVVRVPMEDGTLRREVQKLDGWKATEARAKAEGRPFVPFAPSEGEAARVNANIAKFIAGNPHVTQAEFNSAIDSGKLRF